MAISLYDRSLKRLRSMCASLPELKEATTWGHPTFKAGKKAFAVLEVYDEKLSLALNMGRARQSELLCDAHFYETPYCGHRGWVSLVIDRKTDWENARSLVVESYRSVALKRMLDALASTEPAA
jgi:predicted DNA-binding protein (MmcQ/YjbR family)